MTTTTHRRGLPVFGQHGQAIATVSQARSVYFTSLLAECEHHHMYLVPDDVKAWLATDATCPRCKLLGLA